MFIFFLIITLLIPAAMIGFGLLWKKSPPKKVNKIYGYRTTRSMRNKKTWDFAHRYTAKVMLIIAIPLSIVSIALLYFFKNSDISTLDMIVIIITGIQLAGLCLPIVFTEWELRKRFDEDGNIK